MTPARAQHNILNLPEAAVQAIRRSQSQCCTGGQGPSSHQTACATPRPQPVLPLLHSPCPSLSTPPPRPSVLRHTSDLDGVGSSVCLLPLPPLPTNLGFGTTQAAFGAGSARLDLFCFPRFRIILNVGPNQNVQTSEHTSADSTITIHKMCGPESYMNQWLMADALLGGGSTSDWS